MKNLFYFLVLLAGCSESGGMYSVVEEDTDTETDSDSEDAGTDSGSDSDSDSDSDSEDAGTDSGTGLPCDAGSCCIDGEVAVSGTLCVADVLPENVSDGFDPATDLPHQFRCTEPDVCGSGEEMRVGHTVCDGSSSSCLMENISWGNWEVTTEVSPNPESVCNPASTNGVILWADAFGVDTSRYSCLGAEYSGCSEGKCVPDYTGDECDQNISAFYCGSCENNCFENGGNACEFNDTAYHCVCGTHPACDEGSRCVWDYVVFDYTCIPE